MKFSTKGRYALRLMIDLAQNGGDDFISLKDVSKRQGISVKYLEQIIASLCKAGFVKSIRGVGGGYKLSKSPSEYTVGSILRVTEGCLAPVACLEDEENHCPRSESCPTLPFWQGLYKTILEYADSFTLADLAGNI